MLLKRVIKIAAILAVAVVLVVPGLLWLDHTRETVLPAPTGPFAVGRTSYAWNDPAHDDPLAPQPGTKREILAWIWYPAVQSTDDGENEYLPEAWRTAIEQQWGVTKYLTRDLSRVHAHSVREADVSPLRRSYPVVLMRAGGSLGVTTYTSLAEDLASHGYVVVGIDAPYRTSVVVFPDGRVIAGAAQNNLELAAGAEEEALAAKLVEAGSADMSFALDQLALLNASDPSGQFRGRLDLERIGAFGHSIGGAIAVQFCHDDPRCKACANVDGALWGPVVREGITQPALLLMSDHSLDSLVQSDREAKGINANFHSFFDRMPADRWLEIMIPGSNHYMFSDDAILRSPPVMRVLRALHLTGIDGARQVAITAHFLSTFFDVYLNGAPESELRNPAGYPEVKYLH